MKKTLFSICVALPLLLVPWWCVHVAVNRFSVRDYDSGWALLVSACSFALFICYAFMRIKNGMQMPRRRGKMQIFFLNMVFSILLVGFIYGSYCFVDHYKSHIRFEQCAVYYCDIFLKYDQHANYPNPNHIFSDVKGDVAVFLNQDLSTLRGVLSNIKKDLTTIEGLERCEHEDPKHYLTTRRNFVWEQMFWLEHVVSRRERFEGKLKKKLKFSSTLRQAGLEGVALFDPSDPRWQTYYNQERERYDRQKKREWGDISFEDKAKFVMKHNYEKYVAIHKRLGCENGKAN